MRMRIETKSALILLVTLLIGALLGALATGALAQKRMSRVSELRRGGFATHIERVIQPRDEAQREAVRSVLEAAAQRNAETMRGAHVQIRQNLERLREELDPLLDQEQRVRLEAAAERFGGRGPHFRGPPGRKRRPEPPQSP